MGLRGINSKFNVPLLFEVLILFLLMIILLFVFLFKILLFVSDRDITRNVEEQLFKFATKPICRYFNQRKQKKIIWIKEANNKDLFLSNLQGRKVYLVVFICLYFCWWDFKLVIERRLHWQLFPRIWQRLSHWVFHRLSFCCRTLFRWWTQRGCWYVLGSWLRCWLWDRLFSKGQRCSWLRVYLLMIRNIRFWSWRLCHS